MKVTLIEPAVMRSDCFREKRVWRLAPLTLAALAGLTTPDVEVEAVDDRLEDIDFEARRDLVGISVRTFQARRAYEIAAAFRRRGVPVVLGGHHPSLLPAEAARHADAVVVGEAEGAWHQVLADAAAGRLRRRYTGGVAPDFPAARFDRSVFAGKRYLPVAMVETARGCRFRCSFCSVTTFFGGRFRHRPAADVAAEVAGLAERFVFFVDDNIVADVEAAKALFRALRGLSIRWIGQATLSMAHDQELLALMQASGCQGVLIGIESLHPASLDQARKRWNRAGLGYAEALSAIRDHGIAVVGSFVVGMDGDTPASLEATLEFAVRQRLFAALFNLLTPYPGTDLYGELSAAGRLLQPSWWLDPDFRYGSVVFRPRHFEPEELAETRLSLYRRFYGPRSTVLRLLDGRANALDPWHVLAYLTLNLPAWRDERGRTGLRLGSQ